jgi:hypothetical protein
LRLSGCLSFCACLRQVGAVAQTSVITHPYTLHITTPRASPALKGMAGVRGIGAIALPTLIPSPSEQTACARPIGGHNTFKTLLFLALFVVRPMTNGDSSDDEVARVMGAQAVEGEGGATVQHHDQFQIKIKTLTGESLMCST